MIILGCGRVLAENKILLPDCKWQSKLIEEGKLPAHQVHDQVEWDFFNHFTIDSQLDFKGKPGN